MTALRQIKVGGAVIDAVRDDSGIWVPVKRVCERLGVDHKAQQDKLRDAHWAVGGMLTLTAPGDGKRYRTSCIEHECLPTWLALINPEKVKPEARPVLVAWQKDARRILADAFFGRRGQHSLAGAELRALTLSESEPSLEWRRLWEADIRAELRRVFGVAQPTPPLYRLLYQYTAPTAIREVVRQGRSGRTVGDRHHQRFTRPMWLAVHAALNVAAVGILRSVADGDATEAKRRLLMAFPDATNEPIPYPSDTPPAVLAARIQLDLFVEVSQ